MAAAAEGANEEKGYIVEDELFQEFSSLPNGNDWLYEIGNQVFKMKKLPKSQIDHYTIQKEDLYGLEEKHIKAILDALDEYTLQEYVTFHRIWLNLDYDWQVLNTAYISEEEDLEYRATPEFKKSIVEEYGQQRHGAKKSDILYEDENVCILKPESKDGIEVFHTSDYPSICEEGLYSLRELRKVHPELNIRGKAVNHNVIFFKGPYRRETHTIKSSYGLTPEEMIESFNTPKALAFLKIDPYKTNVFYSESRELGDLLPLALEATKWPLWIYLRWFLPTLVTANPEEEEEEFFNKFYPKIFRTENLLDTPTKQWEVLVEIPHIPPEWFTRCLVSLLKGKAAVNDKAPGGGAAGGAPAGPGARRARGGGRRRTKSIVSSRHVIRSRTHKLIRR